jgi:GAF domain-containing protein
VAADQAPDPDPLDPLEPVEATAAAFRLLQPGDGRLARDVVSLAEEVRRVVPEIIGVSISFNDPAMTFTLAVSDRRLLSLDAVQYVQDGPCLEALRSAVPVEVSEADVLSEENWSLFARASARTGVRSSLSVPVHLGGRVVGGLNVYAGVPDAFEGRAADVAALVQSPVSAAIRDADLDFTGRQRAEETLRDLEDQTTVALAVGVLAERLGVSPEEAAGRLDSAAAQAGVPLVELAALVIDLQDED